ncbi:MAG: hypothetical protein JWO67_4583 [Streptosporangiaceae bacterium]|nr:hypothetical protein [Streptosporangiaceae bacterium]
MSQPGWYPEPYGGVGLRWWDGSTWTQHVQPPAPGPTGGAGPYGPVAGGPVLDTKVDGRHVRADAQSVSYQGRTIALADVEWVRYFLHTTSMRGVFGIGRMRIGSSWYFEVGRYPVMGAEMVAMAFGTAGTKAEPKAWSFLVDLSRRHLEPRLLGELTARVRDGETIDVGAGLKLHGAGLNGANVSLSWEQVDGTSTENGRVWIHQKGIAKPVLSIPLQNPNAVLIPQLFAAFKR